VIWAAVEKGKIKMQEMIEEVKRQREEMERREELERAAQVRTRLLRSRKQGKGSRARVGRYARRELICCCCLVIVAWDMD
jgi:hypothetical protein